MTAGFLLLVLLILILSIFCFAKLNVLSSIEVAAIYENPLNGYRATITNWGPFWGTLALGLFYFALKGCWKHFWLWLPLGVVTLGISCLVYPFIAKDIVIDMYKQRGWVDVRDVNIPASGSFKKCPFCAELIRRDAIVCRFCGRDIH